MVSLKEGRLEIIRLALFFWSGSNEIFFLPLEIDL